MYYTQTDIANIKLGISGNVSTEKVLKHLIQAAERDIDRLEAIEADEYYAVNNRTITNRTRQYYTQKYGWKENRGAENNRLKHGFYWLLVEQKINYILSQAPTFTSPEQEVTDNFLPYFQNTEFLHILKDLATETSNSGIGWLQVYIDADGFNLALIPSEQVIAVYDSAYEKELTDVIRYYPKEHVDIKESEYRYMVEWYDANEVRIYEQNKRGEYELKERKPHIERTQTTGGGIVGQSWGMPPFIRLLNNRIKKSDFHFVKSLIDDYDKSRSDESNALAEMPNGFLAIEGYQGNMADPVQAAKALANIRESRVAFLGTGGAINAIASEPATNSLDRHQKKLKEDIFLFGMGVDFSTDKFGYSPSGIALKFLYSNLDLKANALIEALKFTMQDIFAFYNLYWKMKENREYVIDTINTAFNKSLIFNEFERIQMVAQSKGLISDETLLSNHPWVDNVEEELEAVKEQGAEKVKNAMLTMKGEFEEPEEAGG
jgi:SPP1 family phage portal protein